MDTNPQWTEPLSERDQADLDYRNQLPLEEVLDPYLENFGAIFGSIVFAITLVAILVTNALHIGHGVFIITVPAAFLIFCRDLIYDWWTRSLEQQNREPQATGGREPDLEPGRIQLVSTTVQPPQDNSPAERSVPEKRERDEHQHREPSFSYPPTIIPPSQSDAIILDAPSALAPNQPETTRSPPPVNESKINFPRSDSPDNVDDPIYSDTRGTLYGLCQQLGVFWYWLPFPTVKTVLSHVPFALIPFAFCMFIIIEGLATKGWVEIFAKRWAMWANTANAAVAVAGMGFVSVCICNVSDYSFLTSIFFKSCSTVRRYKHRSSHSAVSRAPILAFRAHTIGAYGTWDRTLIPALRFSV